MQRTIHDHEAVTRPRDESLHIIGLPLGDNKIGLGHDVQAVSQVS
jgi:hypothetical protein